MISFQHDILPLKNIIFRTALRIVLNKDEAEDIVQDTLVKLWQTRETLGNVNSLEALAVTMARNLALDRKGKMDNRVMSLKPEKHDFMDSAATSPDSQLMAYEATTFVQDTINGLPEKQRTIIQLRDIEGKSYKEIAAVLNITESDVKVTLFRARSTLKEKILKKKSLYL